MSADGRTSPRGGTDDVGQISVVVPTRNSGRTIEPCLRALRGQTSPVFLLVVDNFSTDETFSTAEGIADIALQAGPERSAQRNLGARMAKGCVIGFIDSDMYVPLDLAGEVEEALSAGAGAIIVPEISVGSGYWARVRAFERSFYVGCDGVESARFFRRDLFEMLGGFDESLDAGEDWDLTIRAREAGAVVARVKCVIDHDEGQLTFVAAVRRKARYSRGLRGFARKHGARGLLAAADRPYLRKPWLLLRQPTLAVGLVALKAGESLGVLVSLLLPLRAAKARLDEDGKP